MTSELLAAAHHEAGHAVGYLHFGDRFSDVAIYLDEHGVRGHVAVPAGNYDCVAQAVICMCGPLAECRFTGRLLLESRDIARIDLEMAGAALARLDDPPAMVDVIKQARELVDEEWPRIVSIAGELERCRWLGYDEVVRLRSRTGSPH